MFLPTRALAACSLIALAACGGGGGGASLAPAVATAVSPASIPSSAPASSPAAQAAMTSVTLTVAVPPATASSARHAAYISAATRSMKVVVTPSTGTAQTVTASCATTCQTTLNASIGTNTFAVGLYDGASGTGNLLSSGSTTAQIVGGQSNTVAIVFGGNVAALALAVDTTHVVAGTASTIPVTVIPKDAAGNVIVGNDPLLVPIRVATNDTTGSYTVSNASLTTPSSAVSVAYSGGTVSNATLTATSGTATATTALPALVSTGSVTIAIPVPASASPSPSASPTPTPAPTPTVAAAAVPSHVLTYLWYGANYVNATLPASYIASKANFAEMSEQQATIVNAYKAAGGTNAVVYSDPFMQPDCAAPFTVPGAGVCTGPIAQYVTSESAWLHGADGTRLRRLEDGSTTLYQEVLNLGNSAAQSAFTAFEQHMLTNAPGVDIFKADDSGTSFTNGSGDPLTGAYYRYNAAPVEITSDTAYIAAQKAMLAASLRPTIINGSDPATLKPAYNGAFVTAPNVIGEEHEGCINNWLGLKGDANSALATELNGLIANTGYARYAFCFMEGTASPANRIYQLAAWWLTYDPAYSVAAPVSTAPGDGYAVFAEYDIVPRSPLTTAMSDVTTLRTAGGAYVREFGACYQATRTIGACGAVVNATTSAVAMPALQGHYGHALVLDDKSSYTGGTASWTGTIPATIPAMSAVIVGQ